MSSPFLAGSSSSSASSHLSYLIPPRTQPPPPPHLMVQGFSCSVLAQAAGYSGNGVGGVVTTGGSGGVEAAAATAVRQGGRHAGHPPLPRPPPRQCPRCRSGNTKFCYYNNYSRKQPRYFCRACRRHWTEGGTLRDVPVGGGRKNRRGGGKDGATKASTTATAASAAATAAAQGSTEGGAVVDAFPDILRQMLFQTPASCTAVGGGGYSIDLNAWQQMASAPAPQGASDVGAVRGTPADANCGGVQYWSGWQLQDDIPGFDGTF